MSRPPDAEPSRLYVRDPLRRKAPTGADRMAGDGAVPADRTHPIRIGRIPGCDHLMTNDVLEAVSQRHTPVPDGMAAVIATMRGSFIASFARLSLNTLV